MNGVPFGATGPTVSRVSDGSTYRLGFATGQVDIGLRLIDLAAAPEGQPLGDTAFADATRMDSPGRFSPDGSQVAFASDRGGSPQVWVAARDGSALRSLTRLESATVNVGSWSPDGQWVAFDATVAGRTDLYVVADGRRRVEAADGGAGDRDRPRVVARRRVDLLQLERVGHADHLEDARAGREGRCRISTETGFEPRMSPDGRRVYFVDTAATVLPHPCHVEADVERRRDRRRSCGRISHPARGTSPTRASSSWRPWHRAQRYRRPRHRHALRLRRRAGSSDRHRCGSGRRLRSRIASSSRLATGAGRLPATSTGSNATSWCWTTSGKQICQARSRASVCDPALRLPHTAEVARRSSGCDLARGRPQRRPSGHRLRGGYAPACYAITTGMTLGLAPFSASQNWPSFTTSMLSS